MALGDATVADYAEVAALASSAYNAWADRVIVRHASAPPIETPPLMGDAISWVHALRVAVDALHREIVGRGATTDVVVLGAGALREVAELIRSPQLVGCIEAVEPVTAVAEVGLSLIETGRATTWWLSCDDSPMIAQLETEPVTLCGKVRIHPCHAEEYLTRVRVDAPRDHPKRAVLAVGLWDRVDDVGRLRDQIAGVADLAVVVNPRDWRESRPIRPDVAEAFSALPRWECRSTELAVRYIERSDIIVVHGTEVAVARRM